MKKGNLFQKSKKLNSALYPILFTSNLPFIISVLWNIMLQPTLRWKSIVETKPELVVAAAITYRETVRSINIPRLHRLYHSTRAGFAKRFFCPLSRKGEKFSQRLRERHTAWFEMRATGKGENARAETWRGWWWRGNWFCITKPVVRDNEALRKREYACAHSLYELSNYIIIRGRPRSGREVQRAIR